MKTYDLIAMICNPSSYYYITMEEIYKVTRDAKIKDFLVHAHLSVQNGEGSFGEGYCEAMIQYRIVTDEQILRVLKKYYELRFTS